MTSSYFQNGSAVLRDTLVHPDINIVTDFFKAPLEHYHVMVNILYICYVSSFYMQNAIL